MYGDGSQTRSYCFVDDTVEGLVRLMASERAAELPVNIGNPEELSVSDLIDRVLALTGSRSSVVRLPLPVDDPRRRKPDISRAIELLQWSPRVDLAHGLEAMIAWFADDSNRSAAAAYDAPLVEAAE
jgi:UDP-glucuronate decarboxylase